MSGSTAPGWRTARVAVDPVADVQPRLPQWVDDLLGPHSTPIPSSPCVHGLVSDSLAVLTTTVVRAIDMPAEALRAEVTRAYRRLQQTLEVIDRVAVRFWNYIPAIGAPMGQGLDRYMAFNSGRYDAFADGRDGATFTRPMATASAVGISGSDLVVHCLASNQPGTPVENPRQTSSWRYSPRYGPVPPCFARATIATVGQRTALLIGGTASIVGEQSLHQHDADGQLQETLRNIGALVSAAQGLQEDTEPALGRVVDLRAYVSNGDVARVVRRELAARCPQARGVEVVRASMCRPELLVEIEGVADLL